MSAVPHDERISTGSAQADQILGGGFLKNSINIIMGQPGAGKTVFAEQLVFRNAGGDRPILYITTLSEPVSKVVRYLQRFEFYHEEYIGEAVTYEDLGPEISRDGIGALAPFLRENIHRLGPKIIVIDSFKALHDLAPSVPEMRQMLYELTGMLSAYAATVFLVGEYTDEHSRNLPEFAVADGIVQLLRKSQSTRDERFLRVIKLRGSAYLEGMHGFKITAAGLDVYPRLVTPEIPKSYQLLEQRISTGIGGLDKILDGGLWCGSTTLLAGTSGAGKTTMGLQFVLDGAKSGDPALYVHFHENPTRLARAIRNLGADPEQLKASGSLSLMYVSPVELQIDSLIVGLFRQVREQNIRRVVIDAVGDLVAAASDQERLHDYLYSLIQHFTVNGVTSMLAFETAGGITDTGAAAGGRFSFMSDNLILLNLDNHSGTVRRTISVLKARGTAHDLGIHEFEIGAAGVRIY
jgi:circadian clock protein KaiC